MTTLACERGVALLLALMAILLLSAIGFALTAVASTEWMIAANYRDGQEGLYAADAGAARAIDDLSGAGDWNLLLNGSVRSALVDGPPSGVRTLADGSTIDLVKVVNTANCGKVTTCSSSDLTANASGDRPWGANNPIWQLYAYGRLSGVLLAPSVDSSFYVIVMVGDDPSETDGDPLHDGVDAAANPGTGVIAVRAEAFGLRGVHRTVELTAARSGVVAGAVRLLSWRTAR